MSTPAQERATLSTATGFNFNKLQAAACMLASAAVSIALIAWVLKSLF